MGEGLYNGAACPLSGVSAQAVQGQVMYVTEVWVDVIRNDLYSDLSEKSIPGKRK